MKPNHFALLAALMSLVFPFSAVGAGEEGATTPASAITSGKFSIDGRYRYEHVDQDNALKDADASTLRLRLNYRTGQWNGWSAFAEFDHVFHVLVDDFNSGSGTSPNRSEYSVVADPEGSDLNQFYFDYVRDENWKFRVGRQRILLDNQRYVGGVGWRQNEQTYDAFTLLTSSIANTNLSYSYVADVRRIFGQTVSAGKAKLDGHLLNAKISLRDGWTLVPYFYFLDYGDVANAGDSTSTIGARLAGGFKAGDGNLALVAELASQSDAGDNPTNYDAQYVHFDATWALENGIALGLGYESLGADADAGTAFRTPLATLHKFQGWADVFVPPGTAPSGIDDVFATVKFNAGQWKLMAVYHDFSAETGSTDYGTEIDLSAGRKLGDRYSLLLKAALFDADDAAYVDTTKVWLMLTAGF